MTNQRQQCKHLKSVLLILQGGILIIQKGQLYTQSIENIREKKERQFITQSKTRASSQCSLCFLFKHTACMCTQCYSNNQ